MKITQDSLCPWQILARDREPDFCASSIPGSAWRADGLCCHPLAEAEGLQLLDLIEVTLKEGDERGFRHEH